MKKDHVICLKSFIVAAAVMMAAAFVSSCSKEPVQSLPVVHDGMVPLELDPISIYGQTRTRAEVNPGLQDDMIHDMAENSTLRLIVLKAAPSSNVVEKDNIVGQFVYVIQTDKFGKAYPQPCQVDAEGNLIPDSITSEPYYLPAADKDTKRTYYCMAISPAKQLHEVTESGKTIMKIAVKNQENVLVTNNLWTQTMYDSFTVSDKVTDKATASLKPLIHATALIRVKIINGDYVTELTPSSPLLELDRIPTDPGMPWTGDKNDANPSHIMSEYNLAIGEEIKPQHGNNILYNRIYSSDFSKEEYFADEGTAEKPNWTKHIEIIAEETILPMDARPTPMIIRINMKVNLTPMQFHFQTNELFKPGHAYNYTARINMHEDNIYVATWQDIAWYWPLNPTSL